ncbi:hypothetical protein CRG98_011295 [Punica granatum]|uniref:Isopenicillin N synthase-like Fe(2+) 2OG dioxygenase domain-containing protein n=1 Tax=Punica granatum TaxID=22663 RepID=A0A2I0KIZ9_PUNGR|nr:hypothetical protein CRG98_011295 [Punica granatum]
MKEGVRRFYEQDEEVKREYYTRDVARKLVYNSNFDLYTASAANWRDTFFCYMALKPPNPRHCLKLAETYMEYSNPVVNLGQLLFEILSETLGLRPDRLKEMDCAEALAMICHYCPPYPQPELTMGASQHTKNDFLTVLLQDQIGGLQVLGDDGEWFDVPPIPGTLVVNIGDLLQRGAQSPGEQGWARNIGSMLSSMSFQPSEKLFGPIKEPLSEDSPPLYKETPVTEYLARFKDQGSGDNPPLLFCKPEIDSLMVPDTEF